MKKSLNLNPLKKHLACKWLFLLILLPCTLSAQGRKNTVRLVLLPDTQYYADIYRDAFYAQTRWIAGNAGRIDFVLQQGDLTDRNLPQEWRVISQGFEMLDDAGVPYSFVPGNHDTGTRGSTDVRKTVNMDYFLPVERYSGKEHFGGVFEEGSMANSWHEFTSGRHKFLVLSLEFGPRDEVLDWAGRIIEAYPSHNVIINTHAYMYSDNLHMGAGEGHKWLPAEYKLGQTGSGAVNNGEQMWEKLVSRYPNVLMVVSGHVLGSGTGMLVGEGVRGNKVYQMLANYQTGVKGSENGGDGFLRIVDIDASRRRIDVTTYSPYTDTYKEDPDQKFGFTKVRLVK